MKFNRSYFLLCIIALLQGFIFYGPIATVYRQYRGISIFDIFLIESIFMVLMILFEIPCEWFADRFGYKKTLVSALSLPVASGCDSALLYSSIYERQSEKAFGRYYSLSTLGFLLATPASTFITVVSMELTALLTIIPYGISVFAVLITETSHSATVFLNQLQYLRSGIGIRYFGIILAAIRLLTLLYAEVYAVVNSGIGKSANLSVQEAFMACSRFAVCFRTPHALFPAVKGKEIGSRYWGSA